VEGTNTATGVGNSHIRHTGSHHLMVRSSTYQGAEFVGAGKSREGVCSVVQVDSMVGRQSMIGSNCPLQLGSGSLQLHVRGTRGSSSTVAAVGSICFHSHQLCLMARVCGVV
jgi:hypothetical protein